jgi:putative SOS response-associated peptidase YedK
MPVVVAPQDHDRWLLADETDLEPAWQVIGREPPGFSFWPVDRKVGSWKASGEDLINPISGGELRSDDAPPPAQASLL